MKTLTGDSKIRQRVGRGRGAEGGGGACVGSRVKQDCGSTAVLQLRAPLTINHRSGGLVG